MKKILLFSFIVALLCSWSLAIASNSSDRSAKSSSASNEDIAKKEMLQKEQIYLQQQEQAAIEEERAAEEKAEIEALEIAREQGDKIAVQEKEAALQQSERDRHRMQELIKERNLRDLTEEETLELKSLFMEFYPEMYANKPSGGGTILVTGDDCSDPFIIPESFPYTDAGNTCTFLDDCDVPGTDNSDVIYQLDITSLTFLSVSLCASTYDTRLTVYQDVCCSGPSNWYLYNDDNYSACGSYGPSYVEGAFPPGTYYIVVDGYGSACGDYQLDIDTYTPPSGRCCYGDPVQCADNTEFECDGLAGTWDEGLNCTDNPCPVPPENDDCTGAIALTDPLPITVNGSTALAINDYGPFGAEPACWEGSWYPTSGAAPDVVYTWIVPADGDYIISLCGSSYDTALLIYNNVCPPVYPDDFICGNDDFCGLQSELTLSLSSGQEIMIVVDGYGSASGDFTLNISEFVPPTGRCCYGDPVQCADNTQSECDALGGNWDEGLNCTDNPCPVTGDNCSDPIIIPESFPYSDADNTCGFTNTCDITGSDNSDVIYRLDITTTVNLAVSLCNSAFDTKLAIFLTDCCTGAGTEWRYNDDNSAHCSPSTRSYIEEHFTPGTYYIVVDGYSSYCGDYQLDISEYFPPMGRCCYGDPVQCVDNIQAECIELGGIWVQGFTCAENPCPGPEGNDCSDPVVVDLDAVGLPYTDAGQTTCGRLDDYNATCLGIYDNGEDIIYEIIVGTAEDYVFTLDPLGTTYTGILLDDTCPPGGSGQCIDYVTGYSGTTPKVMQDHLEPGTYYVMVDKYSTPTCIPAFNLTIDYPPVGRCCYNDFADCTDNIREADCLLLPGNPDWSEGINCTEYPCASVPSNDVCADRIMLDIPSDTYGSTIFANPDTTPSCGTTNGTGGGVWYSVIGTGNTITATLCDELTDFDTKMRVYCFDCGDLFCVGGNDDSSCPSGNLKSTVEWCSEAGTEYFILVHGFSANVGYFMLHLTDDGTPCEDPPVCAPPSGACCVGLDCVGTMYEIDCGDLGGYWYEGEDCDAGFECPIPRQVGLATTANIPDVGVSNFGPLGEYDSQNYTYDWNAQDPVNFAGTFVMGNSQTTMFSYYNAGITDCWEYTATDFLNMDDTFHPTGQYNDSGVLGGLTIDYCGHGFNIDNPPEEAGDIFVHVFTVTNNGTEAVDNYYAGVYYDWDIGGTDLVTFDRDDNLIIQGPDETYNYGICLLNAADVGLTSLAGVSQQDYIYPSSHPPGGWQMADLYNIMSAGTDQIWDAPFTDMSSLVSSGPHTINPGESITFKFAVIGGAATADIIADAQYALANLDIPDCAGGGCGPYVVGDYNGSGAANVADVVDMFSRLKTGSPVYPELDCECPFGSGNIWAVRADVNASCNFNVADVVGLFSYLKTGDPLPEPCPDCPPQGSPRIGGDQPLVRPTLKSKAKISTQQGAQ